MGIFAGLCRKTPAERKWFRLWPCRPEERCQNTFSALLQGRVRNPDKTTTESASPYATRVCEANGLSGLVQDPRVGYSCIQTVRQLGRSTGGARGCARPASVYM